MIKVSATDKDIGKNADVFYSIQTGDKQVTLSRYSTKTALKVNSTVLVKESRGWWRWVLMVQKIHVSNNRIFVSI